MKKPTLTQIRTSVRKGKVNKVYRLYQKFTDDYGGVNPIKQGCTNVQLERVCTNALILKFIGKTMSMSMKSGLPMNRSQKIFRRSSRQRSCSYLLTAD